MKKGKQHFETWARPMTSATPAGITALNFAEGQVRARAFFLRKAHEFAAMLIPSLALSRCRRQSKSTLRTAPAAARKGRLRSERSNHPCAWRRPSNQADYEPHS
jgi:hypothetical protein